MGCKRKREASWMTPSFLACATGRMELPFPEMGCLGEEWVYGGEQQLSFWVMGLWVSQAAVLTLLKLTAGKAWW